MLNFDLYGSRGKVTVAGLLSHDLTHTVSDPPSRRGNRLQPAFPNRDG
jgi:hypothetical protein